MCPPVCFRKKTVVQQMNRELSIAFPGHTPEAAAGDVVFVIPSPVSLCRFTT